MDIFAAFTIITSVLILMAVLVPVMIEDSPLTLLVIGLLPLVVMCSLGGMHKTTLLLCLLIICSPFILYRPSKRK